MLLAQVLGNVTAPAEIDCLHQADLADYPDTFIPITLGKTPALWVEMRHFRIDGLHGVIAVAVRRVLLAE